MANSHAGFGSRLGAVLLGAGLALATSALVLAPATAAEKKDEKKPEQLSPKVIEKLKPAHEALDKADVEKCVSLSKEALEASKTPYDTLQSMTYERACYGKVKDIPNYVAVTEELIKLPNFPDEERTKAYQTLAQFSSGQKNFDKAIEYTTKWQQAGGGPDADTMLWQLYLMQHDCTHGIVALEKAVAGREATETELRQQNACYYELKDGAKRQAVMEQLVKRFMKHDYVYDLLLIYEDQKIDAHAKLNIWRLEFQKDYQTRESEFVEFAEEALDAGSPIEALTVLNRGIQQQAVKLIAASDRPSRLLAQAKQQAAEDKKQVAALDKEAQAGKSGEADVKVGLVYLGLGDNQKAVDSITRGLTPERVAKVKRVDDANMMLGIANARLGNKDAAVAAFKIAQADPRMAKAATIWIDSL